MSFSSLGLSEAIVRAVSEHGYTTPTPIQAQAIPAVLNGGDLLAGAQTGTGKTAGFVLPILQRLTATPTEGKRKIRVLVLTPTRELAAQVEESVRTYGKYTGIKSLVIFGGVGINPQISAMRQGVDILVATPGRLLDHHQQRTVDLSHVEILVLDEADRMLDMGFIHDIKKILAILPKKRQNLLFSATFSDDIKRLADSLLDNPALIEVARRNSTVEMITQKVHPVDRDKKKELLTHLIKQNNWHQVLVFTRTKHGANRLAEGLNKSGITALAIHGNKSQSARTKALAEFKTGDLAVLVATDIAARGIDIDQLPHVVNFEIPNVPEDYVHRIGRTGRAGATGEAVSLVCIDEKKMFNDIERLIKRDVEVVVVPGFEPDPHAKAQPIQMRSQDHQGRGGQGRGRPGGGGSGRGAPTGGGQGKPRTGGGGGNGGGRSSSGGGQGNQSSRGGSSVSGSGQGAGQSASRPPREGGGGSANTSARSGGGGTARTAKPAPALFRKGTR
ncbi:MAG TPA: DEAD/DEAH box helicase [Usitatibacteraceae bacterium]